jgi:hypothetical protein
MTDQSTGATREAAASLGGRELNLNPIRTRAEAAFAHATGPGMWISKRAQYAAVEAVVESARDVPALCDALELAEARAARLEAALRSAVETLPGLVTDLLNAPVGDKRLAANIAYHDAMSRFRTALSHQTYQTTGNEGED